MLLGLVPQIGDLCEIDPLSYKEVPCEIIDVNHTDFLYKVLFNLKQSQQVHWITSSRINWIARRYKIFDITEIENDAKTKTVLIVEAISYEIIYYENDNKISFYETFSENSELIETFILNSQSKMAHYILNDPERPKVFNLMHFKKGQARLKSGMKQVFFTKIIK